MVDGDPRADRGGEDDISPSVRRAAAAVGAGVRGRRPARAGVPRRADRGHGRSCANCGVGVDRCAAPRRCDRRLDHPSADRSRGAGRSAGDHRPRCRGGERHSGRADEPRRGEPTQVQGPTHAGPDSAGLGASRGIHGIRAVAGRIPGGRAHRPAGGGDGDRVVREAGCAGQRHAGGAAQPRGCVPRFDGAGVAVVTNRFASGTFTPDPRPNTVSRMLRAQFALELKLLLRNGEQLLLTMFIPITLLVGLTQLPFGSFGQAIMALAVISTAFTGQAIAVAFDRRYGALKRLGATALPVWGIIAGKSLAVVTVVFLQSILLGAIGFALGWRPNIAGLLLGAVIIALGTAGFAALGLLLGGTLRAEIVLAVANLLWFVFAGLGALTLEGGMVPHGVQWVARLTPSGALTEALTRAMTLSVDWFGIAVLAVWGGIAALCALRWFRFT